MNSGSPGHARIEVSAPYGLFLLGRLLVEVLRAYVRRRNISVEVWEGIPVGWFGQG